jgi:hypothetical protein
MMVNIIPQDNYNHIEDLGCSCNPIVTIVEGEEIIYHNDMTEYCSCGNYIGSGICSCIDF